MHDRNVEIGRFGAYTAYRGKLGHGDSRSAYVTGPAVDGSIRPLASFWFEEEAIRWAKDHADKAEREKGQG